MEKGKRVMMDIYKARWLLSTQIYNDTLELDDEFDKGCNLRVPTKKSTIIKLDTIYQVLTAIEEDTKTQFKERSSPK